MKIIPGAAYVYRHLPAADLKGFRGWEPPPYLRGKTVYAVRENVINGPDMWWVTQDPTVKMITLDPGYNFIAKALELLPLADPIDILKEML